MKNSLFIRNEQIMKEIGGFFEFEINKDTEYYNDAVKINSGRNAINYILQAHNTKIVYVPYFTCETVIEPIETLGLKYIFYHIDEKLEILDIKPEKMKSDEKIIYINYFGIKNHYVDDLAMRFGDKLIVDNTQAFYKKPIDGINTCYSPRKFFGVADGGYVYTNASLEQPLEREYTFDRCQFLLGRVEKSASEIYADYCNHNENMCFRPLMKMSKLTQDMLSSINYEKARLTRERNFWYLNDQLKEFNELKMEFSQITGPMVYPFLIKMRGLRAYLIKNKVYVATYWAEVLDYIDDPESFEVKFTNYLLPLPIDQRYELTDMETIVQLIKKYIVKK